MNLEEHFRLRFQSLLAAGLASSPIATRLGLAAASEVWGGVTPRDRPAWYLWLRDVPGAWQLELAAADPLDGAAGTVGRFTLRHYPCPGTPALALFSAEEQRLAAEALDRTGTPRIERASSIPADHFVVGAIDWALDARGETAVFALATLDRLRRRAGDGALLRDVPGWSLSSVVFSVVAGLHAQVERRAATRLVLSRLPGFETSAAGDAREAPERAFGEAFVAFAAPRTGEDVSASVLDALRDPEAELLLDVRPRESTPPSPLDPRLPLTVSGAWFGGERHAPDRALCAC